MDYNNKSSNAPDNKNSKEKLLEEEKNVPLTAQQIFLDSQDWFQLLDQKISQIDVAGLLEVEVTKEQMQAQKNEMVYKKFTDQGKLSEYMSYKNLGMQFSFEEQELNSIFLYNKFDKIMRKYLGSLPYKLNFSKTNGDIVAQLGEPTRTSGGKSIPICLTYEHLGIEITFLTKNWQDHTSPVDFICIFQKSQKDEHKLCGICKKQTAQKCQQCQLVYYCSRNCQSNHWKVHKKFCFKENSSNNNNIPQKQDQAQTKQKDQNNNSQQQIQNQQNTKNQNTEI